MRIKLAWVLPGLLAASILMLVVLLFFGPRLANLESVQADGFSRSAIGHRAFIELLRALQIPVVVSRDRSLERNSNLASDEEVEGEEAQGEADAGEDAQPAVQVRVARASGLLILAEPRSEHLTKDDLDQALRFNSRVLVVLAKRSAIPEAMHPNRAAVVEPAGEPFNTELLGWLGVKGTLHTEAGAFRPTFEGPLSGLQPTLVAAQLLKDGNLKPLVQGEGGLLIGERRIGDSRVVILTDPDLLATFNISAGDNSPLLVQLIQRERRGGPVIFDEEVHGFAAKPSLAHELFAFPLGLALAQALLSALVFLWAGAVRFGLPTPYQPPFAPGKQLLIRNAAELLRFGGHAGPTLRRYQRALFDDLRQVLHLPTDLTGPALVQRLALVSRTGNLKAIEQRALEAAGDNDPARVLAAAKELHAFWMEVHRAAR